VLIRNLTGLHKLLDEARLAGVRIAAVSNANRANANFFIDSLNLRTYFEVVVLGEDCEFGKPHPMPYLTAMKKFGLTPERCVVFEDSVTGLTSGFASGATVIGITTTNSEETLLKLGAKIAINDFSTITLADIVNLLPGMRNN